jgi:hypothetical protein
MTVSLVPLFLAVLGAVVPLVGSGFTVFGLAALWLGAIAVVTLVRAVARPKPEQRIVVDVVLLVLTALVLFPLGGWWFVPAVVAQTLLDRRTAGHAARHLASDIRGQ